MRIPRACRTFRVGVVALAALTVALAAARPVALPAAGLEARRIRIRASDGEVALLLADPGAPARALGMALTRYGAPGDPRPAESPLVLASDDRIELLRGPLVEWFRADADGVEHGLEIRSPEASAVLVFDFALRGGVTPKVSEDGQRVVLRDALGTPVLVVFDPRARDADGREVDVRWERVEPADASGAGLRLEVQGADRAFPIQVMERFGAPAGVSKRAAAARPARGGPALLAAPANDLCPGAEVIPGGGPFPHLTSIVDLASASTVGDPPVPTCQSDVSRSVWFAFTPTTSAAYTFSVCSDAPTATTAEDTVLALYSSAATCAGLAQMSGGCSDDACGTAGLQSAIGDIQLTAGTTYYVVAWIYGSAAPPPGASELQLHVEQTPPSGPAPPNDRCDGAEPIPGSGPFPWLTSITADVTGATTAGDPPVPSCQPSVSRSIWYSFIPAASGRYAFSVCADGPTASTVDDTVMALYAAAAACSGFAPVPGACDDDSCTGEAAQSAIGGIDLVAGTRYYVVVWVYGTAAPAAGNTSIQVRVSRVGAPPDDSCAAATALPLDTPFAGSTVAALDDTRLPSGSTCFSGIGQTPSIAPGGDIAYRFTAPADGRYSFRVGGFDSSRNAVLYAATDCPAGSAPALVTGCLLAANRNASSPEEIPCLPLLAGQPVYVFVDEDAATSGSAFVIEANRCPIESEPNGTPALAGEPACGVEGSIAPAGDADFYSLGSPPAGSRVFALVDGAAGNSTDFDLRVTTAADTLEYDDFNNDVPFGSASACVSGTRLDGTPSYLRVSHYSSVAQAEPYHLYYAVQPPASQATPEVEPDDTIATATGSENGYYSGALSAATDVDLFSFSAVAGDQVQIGLDLDPARDNTPFNGSLALLDAAGSTLLLVSDPSSASSSVSGTGSLTATTPFSPGEAIAFRIRSTGTHYARVAWSSGTPGDYLLSIAHGCRAGSPDGDGDGVPDLDDCAPADPAAWAIPGEAVGLVFPSAADPALLQWSAPSMPGGTVVRFDLLRSASAADFQAPACLTTNGTATSGTDAAVPGVAFYYLVRSRNVCGGNPGTRSDGTARIAGSCP